MDDQRRPVAKPPIGSFNNEPAFDRRQFARDVFAAVEAERLKPMPLWQTVFFWSVMASAAAMIAVCPSTPANHSRR